jgi:putative transposase
MPRPLSNDLRARIVRAVEDGASCNATARRFDVSASTVIKLMQAYRATGSYECKRMGGYRKAILAGHKDKVLALVAGTPDATLDELVRHLNAARIEVGRSSLARFLVSIGLRFKKNTSRQRTGPA